MEQYTARALTEAMEEETHEIVGRQMREIVNLNADQKRKQREAAAAAQRRKEAAERATMKKWRRIIKRLVTACSLYILFAVGVLGYLVGIGYGKEVTISLAVASGVVLGAVAVAKVIAARKSKKGGAA